MLALRFLIYGGVWSASLAVLSLPITLLPPVRRTFPGGWRRARSLLLVGCFAAVSAFGTLYLHHELTPRVTVTLVSDPAGADVYVAGQWRGTTPWREDLAQGSTRRYAVVGDSLSYFPFADTFTATQDANIEVWLERLSDNDQDTFLRRPLFKGDTFSVESNLVQAENDSPAANPIAIQGRLSNFSGDDVPYVIVSFLLFDAENELLGSTYATVYNSSHGSNLRFEAALPTGVTASEVMRYRLLNIVPLADDAKSRRAVTTPSAD
ncbi:MAG: FxLYD domain-containing protein [Deinococcota bacterium]